MALVFEKPQKGITLDLSGLSEADAIALVMKTNETAPPHPSTINLGCGPEPEGLNEDALRLSVQTLLSVPDNTPVGDAKLDLAHRTGAWFYWQYACRLAENELRERLGEGATEAIYGEDRTQYFAVRREKLRWVMKERFGFDLP